MPLLLEGRRFSEFWLRREEARGVRWPLDLLADGDEVGKWSGEEAVAVIRRSRLKKSWESVRILSV